MSGVQPPGARPDVWATLGDLLRRIRALEESVPDSGGDGILFDFDNQGGYLDIQTHDTDGAGHGLLLDDESGSGILITADGGAVGIDLESDGSRIQINDGSGGITITGGNSPGGPIVIDAGPTDITIDGAAVYVLNLPSSDPGNPGQLYELAGVVMVSL